jgi:hypothetical protein
MPKLFGCGRAKMLEIPLNQEHLVIGAICFQKLSTFP